MHAIWSVIVRVSVCACSLSGQLCLIVGRNGSDLDLCHCNRLDLKYRSGSQIKVICQSSRSRDEKMQPKLFVCLSVRSYNLKTTRPNFTIFLCMLLVHGGPGSVLLWWLGDTLCTSGFVDDVTFSFSGTNGPQSSSTLCLKGVCRVAVPVKRQKPQCLVGIIILWHRGRSLLCTMDLFFAAEHNGWSTASPARKSSRLHRRVFGPCSRNWLEKCPLEHLRGRHWRLEMWGEIFNGEKNKISWNFLNFQGLVFWNCQWNFPILLINGRL